MKNRNKLVRMIKWVFAEDKNEEHSNIAEEDIQLGPLQIILIILMTGILLFWIFYEPIKTRFISNKSVLQPRDYIEANIEKNYFRNNKKLKNDDFSMGIQHWATSDGGTLFPDSKSIASIDNKDYHSASSSLKIECIAPASRYHYSKRAKNNLLNNVYGFNETSCWMGVLPGSKVKGSLWYKGDIIKFSVNYLKTDGEWGNLASVSGAKTSQWSQLEINEKIPLETRAIMLEITLNQAQGAPAPVVWVDDVNIQVDNSGNE